MIRKNIFSIIVALVIMYLSLANADTFKKVSFINFPNIDKVVHFGMYFGLMSTIIFENRKSIQRTRQLFLIGIIPLSYGILMEIFQGIFTTTRFADIYDVLFNAFGIIGSILLWILIKPMIKI
jgi:VanZ family protein